MLFYGFDSSFPTGVFPVEDSKVRRTDYNRRADDRREISISNRGSSVHCREGAVNDCSGGWLRVTFPDTRLYRAGWNVQPWILRRNPEIKKKTSQPKVMIARNDAFESYDAH